MEIETNRLLAVVRNQRNDAIEQCALLQAGLNQSQDENAGLREKLSKAQEALTLLMPPELKPEST